MHHKTEHTTLEIAEQTGIAHRTIKRWVQRWINEQSEPTVPRIRKGRPGGAKRWCYLISGFPFDKVCSREAKRSRRFLRFPLVKGANMSAPIEHNTPTNTQIPTESGIFEKPDWSSQLPQGEASASDPNH